MMLVKRVDVPATTRCATAAAAAAAADAVFVLSRAGACVEPQSLLCSWCSGPFGALHRKRFETM